MDLLLTGWRRLIWAVVLVCLMLPVDAGAIGEKYVPAYNELARMCNDRLLAIGVSSTYALKEAGQSVMQAELRELRNSVRWMMTSYYCLAPEHFVKSAPALDDAFPYGLRYDIGDALLQPSLMTGIGEDGWFTMVPGELTADGQTRYGSDFTDVPLLWVHFEELHAALSQMKWVRLVKDAGEWTHNGEVNRLQGNGVSPYNWIEARDAADAAYGSGMPAVDDPGCCWTMGDWIQHNNSYAAERRQQYGFYRVERGIYSALPRTAHFYCWPTVMMESIAGPNPVYDDCGTGLRRSEWNLWSAQGPSTVTPILSPPLGREASTPAWGAEPTDAIPKLWRGYWVPENCGCEQVILQFDDLYEGELEEPEAEEDDNFNGVVESGCDCVDCTPDMKIGWQHNNGKADGVLRLGQSSGLRNGGLRVSCDLRERTKYGYVDQMINLHTRVLQRSRDPEGAWDLILFKRPSGAEVLFSMEPSGQGSPVDVAADYVMQRGDSRYEITFIEGKKRIVQQFDSYGNLVQVSMLDDHGETSVQYKRGKWPGLELTTSGGRLDKVICFFSSADLDYADDLIGSVTYNAADDGRVLKQIRLRPGSRIYQELGPAGEFIKETRLMTISNRVEVWRGVSTNGGVSVSEKVTTQREYDAELNAFRVTRTTVSFPDTALARTNVSATLVTPYPWGEEVTAEIDGYGAPVESTTRYKYHADPNDTLNYKQLAYVEGPDGSWTRYHAYDAAGRHKIVTGSWLDVIPESGPSASRASYYHYAGDELLADLDFPADDTAVTNDARPRLTIVKLRGDEVGRTYNAYPPGRHIVKRCVEPDAAYDAVSNLTTVTWLITGGDFNGRPYLVEHEDGTRSVFDYYYNSTMHELKTIRRTGSGTGTSVTNGTRTTTLRDDRDRTVSQLTEDIASGITLANLAYEYDAFGRETAVSDLLAGTVRTISHGCCGPESETDEDGVQSSYAYDLLGRRTAAQRHGIDYLYTYDVLGNVVESRMTAPGEMPVVTRSTYDEAGRLAATEDAAGNLTAYGYATNFMTGPTVTTTYADGGTLVERYFRDGRLKAVSGSAAAPRCYAYGADATGEYTIEYEGTNTGAASWVKTSVDGLGRVVLVSHADGYARVSTYNARGQLASERDGYVTTLYGYDDLGRLRYTAIDINRNGRIDLDGPDQVTAGRSEYTTFRGVPVLKTSTAAYATAGSAAPQVVSAQFAALDGKQQWSAAFGRTNHVEATPRLQAATRVETSTLADGTTALTTYDKNQVTIALRRDNTGNQFLLSTWERDLFGRVRVALDTAPSGEARTTAYAYNDAGLVTNLTVSAGTLSKSFGYSYDVMGRLTQVRLPDGSFKRSTYDVRGNIVASSGAGSYPVACEYDEQGRMLALRTYRAGVEGDADTTRWEYDPVRGRPVRKRYADGRGVDYAYFLDGALQSKTQARGIVTTYSYDAARRLAQRSHSDGTAAMQLMYDRLGRVTNVLDGVGAHTMAYCPDGKLAAVSCPQLPDAGVDYAYDAIGRLAEMAVIGAELPAGRRVAYGYDHAGRLATIAEGGATHTYTYGPGSALAGLTHATDGTDVLTVSRSYDGFGRLLAINHAAGATVVNSFAYQYDALDRRERIEVEDGAYWRYAYDPLGQVVSGRKYFADGVQVGGAQFDYQYDEAGNRAWVRSGAGWNGTAQTYTANALNQYTRMTVPGRAVISGEADADASVSIGLPGEPVVKANRHGRYFWQTVMADNRAGPVVVSNNVVAIKPDGSNCLVRVDRRTALVSPATVEFQYDADGNLLRDGCFQYTWDAENRLIRTESLPSVPLERRIRVDNTHDYTGRRVRKVVSSWTGSGYHAVTTNTFLYDGWNLISELTYSPTHTRTNSYTWGLDLSGTLQGAGGIGALLSVVDGGTTSVSSVLLPTCDANGNLINLVTPAGTIAATYEYAPFGAQIRATGPAAETNPFRFSTKYYDPETDTLYFGHRTYRPSTGRFLSRDPLQEQGGPNLYNFTHNTPPNAVDPLGLALYAFDGTGTRRETWTHISILFRSYEGEAHYADGVGSRWYSKPLGGGFGLGGRARVNRMYENLVKTYRNDEAIDIIGFSRGAALAREFANEIYEKGIVDSDGTVVACNPKIRFVGLFDTVGSFGMPGNHVNLGVKMDLPPNVENAAQAIAADERRREFPLTPLNDALPDQKFAQRVFKGDHSDIGGGHQEFQNLLALGPLFFIWRQGRAADVPFGAITLVQESDFELYLKANGELRPWPYVPSAAPHDLTDKLLYTDGGKRTNLPN